MEEAFKVLARAKREAEARLRQYEQEGKASAHKVPSVRHAIRELEQGERALKFMHDEWLKLVRLWTAVEEGNRSSVQKIHSGNSGSGRSAKGSSNRRR